MWPQGLQRKTVFVSGSAFSSSITLSARHRGHSTPVGAGLTAPLTPLTATASDCEFIAAPLHPSKDIEQMFLVLALRAPESSPPSHRFRLPGRGHRLSGHESCRIEPAQAWPTRPGKRNPRPTPCDPLAQVHRLSRGEGMSRTWRRQVCRCGLIGLAVRRSRRNV